MECSFAFAKQWTRKCQARWIDDSLTGWLKFAPARRTRSSKLADFELRIGDCEMRMRLFVGLKPIGEPPFVARSPEGSSVLPLRPMSRFAARSRSRFSILNSLVATLDSQSRIEAIIASRLLLVARCNSSANNWRSIRVSY